MTFPFFIFVHKSHLEKNDNTNLTEILIMGLLNKLIYKILILQL